ncbi:MAG: hypothetical protein WD638_01465 [Nitriliruptoraceae bacterium]
MSDPGQDPSDAAELLAALPEPDALVPADTLGELVSLPTPELRRMRNLCEEAEEGVSYARRLLQGRLDILRAALDDRDEPAAGHLLSSLPRILSDRGGHADASHARSTRVRVPPGADRYSAALDTVLAEDEAEALEERSIDDLERLVVRLGAYEHELSVRRRALFDRIDALRSELADRYKDGRADVRELLS